MTNKEFEAIGDKLSPYLPNFIAKGSRMIKTPIGDILYALQFDGSDFESKSFCLCAFFLPLYVPLEVIHFLFGIELGRKLNRWDGDDPNCIIKLSEAIQQEAKPFFEKTSTLSQVVEFLRIKSTPNMHQYINPHNQETLAYTLAKIGQIDAALLVVDRLQNILKTSATDWELKIRSRSKLFREKLLTGPRSTQMQLNVWKEENICKLKLEKFSLI